MIKHRVRSFKALASLVCVVTLTACSGSSEDEASGDDESGADVPPRNTEVSGDGTPIGGDDEVGEMEGIGVASNEADEMDGAGLAPDEDFFAGLRGVDRFDQDNFLPLLETMAAMTRGAPVLDVIDFLYELELDVRDGASSLTPLNLTEGLFNRVHLCPDGGRLLAIVGASGFGVGPGGGSYVYETCGVDGRVIDGGFVLDARVVERSDELFHEFSLASSDVGILVESDEYVRVTGALRQSVSLSEGAETFGSMPNTLRYTTISFDGPVGAAEMPDIDDVSPDRVRSDGSYVMSLGGFARLENADGTGTRGLALAPAPAGILARSTRPGRLDLGFGAAFNSRGTNGLLADSPDGNYTLGQLDLTFLGAPGGNRISVQMDNGDPGSIDVFVFEDDDTVASYTVPWSPALQFGSERRLRGLRALLADDAGR